MPSNTSCCRHVRHTCATTEPFGLGAQDAVDYLDSFPVWADAAWALGVCGAVLGSLLLLLRSRFVVPAFVVSLVGGVIGPVHQLGNSLPGVTHRGSVTGFAVIIAISIGVLGWYALAMTRRGVLR